jgi:hypothetical protein
MKNSSIREFSSEKMLSLNKDSELPSDIDKIEYMKKNNKWNDLL